MQIEFDDPVTKRHLIWKPIGIPRIKPLALHFHGQPYVFGVPYLETDFIEFGCPNPSYVIYTYKGGRWKRIKLSDLPVKFERVNLLTDSGDQIVENNLTQYVKAGGLLKAGSIDNAGSREFYHRIIDDMKSPYAICSYGYNLPTTFDSVEFN